MEKQIIQLSSKLKQFESEKQVLNERLKIEEGLKEEYHQSFRKAQSDLEKLQERTQTSKSSLQDRVYTLENLVNTKQDNLDDANNEIKSLKDENHRLKSAIVNKDSENQSLQLQVDKERERREAESGKLERMLTSE